MINNLAQDIKISHHKTHITTLGTLLSRFFHFRNPKANIYHLQASAKVLIQTNYLNKDLTCLTVDINNHPIICHHTNSSNLLNLDLKDYILKIVSHSNIQVEHLRCMLKVQECKINSTKLISQSNNLIANHLILNYSNNNLRISLKNNISNSFLILKVLILLISKSRIPINKIFNSIRMVK